MSGQKRPIAPRIPQNLDLPPLSETVQQESAPAPQQPVQQPQQPPHQPAPQQPAGDEATVPQEPQVTAEHQDEPTYDIPESAEQFDERNTYYQVGTENTGTLEFDLIAHRQRGVEKRYLNVQVKGLILGKDKKEVGDCRMNITSKEQFEGLKEFFTNLNWED